MLKENLEKVEENIQAACDRAGRKRDEVTLIAVSKTKPVEMLQEAYDLGVRINCLLYTSPSPRDSCASRMPSSA